MEKPNSNRLPLYKIIAFASGDIFGGGSFNIINFLYPGFLALTIGLPAQTAGALMMIARVFDAVIDPAIGFFSDKLRVKFGTRRGALIFCAPFLVLSMFLMFYPYKNPDESIRFWSVLCSYMLFCAVQSVIMISYYSLSSEITEDYTERARMTSFRLGFSIFSSIVCVAVPGMIVNLFDGNEGYIAMSLIFGAIFMVCVGLTGLFAKEGIRAPKKAEPFSVKDFIKPFKAKPFRQYLYIFLCCQITMAIMSALFFFYIDFYFCRDITASGQSNTVGLIGAALMFGMQIAALPFYMMMIKKTGKMTVYIVGAVIWIAGALVLFFIPANASPVVIYILAAVLGFGISGPGLIPHAIFGDVVDAGNLQFGTHTAGSFSGVANFINQVSQALGLAFVMTVIGAAGFVEQDISEGAVKITEQPAFAQNAIIAVMAAAPLVFMSVGIFVCTRYKLNKESHARVLDALEDRENAEKRERVLREIC